MPSLHNGVRGIATNVRTQGSKTIVRYHDTDVVTFDGNTVILRTGGWKTATTKTRMNQASFQYDLRYHVHQTKGKWFVRVGGWGASYGHDIAFPRSMIRLDRAVLNGEVSA